MPRPLLSPRIHGQYKDGDGPKARTLRVTVIDPSNGLGREIQGRVTLSDGTTYDYSATMKDFPEIWIKEIL